MHLGSPEERPKRSEGRPREGIAVVIFSCPEAAVREGFRVVGFDRESDLYVVERDLDRKPLRVRECAFARQPGQTTVE